MKKRFYLALSALAISTALTIPVFAGTWKQDNYRLVVRKR